MGPGTDSFPPQIPSWPQFQSGSVRFEISSATVQAVARLALWRTALGWAGSGSDGIQTQCSISSRVIRQTARWSLTGLAHQAVIQSLTHLGKYKHKNSVSSTLLD